MKLALLVVVVSALLAVCVCGAIVSGLVAALDACEAWLEGLYDEIYDNTLGRGL